MAAGMDHCPCSQILCPVVSVCPDPLKKQLAGKWFAPCWYETSSYLQATDIWQISSILRY